MSLKEYLKKKKHSRFSINGVEILIKDNPPDNVDPKKVLNYIFNRIPNHLLINFKTINIGSFEALNKRNLQAMYSNSNIYVSNKLKSNQDLLDDVIHEIAHSVEEKYEDFIYSDEKIKQEFLHKRKKLWNILKNEGYHADLEQFLNTKYDQEFDKFLYMTIGYPILGMYSKNIFYSPYGCTSLREYFANGFEAFFMKENISLLKKVSPILYNRIVQLSNIEEINNELRENYQT